MDGERNARFAHDLSLSVCTLHKHETIALSQHVLRPYSSSSLDVAGRTYNYRLTRERRILLCAFVIVYNKWRIFRLATDVCPNFCDVTVITCCILHNFVRQRDGFQFQGTLCECPLESIKAVGNRGNVTGTDMGRRAQGTGMSVCWGQPGRGLVYRWLMCRRRVWRRALLSIGAPLGRMGWGVRSPGTLRDSWRWALETEHSSLWALCEGNLEGGSVPEDSVVYVEKALLTGISLHRVPSGRGIIYQRHWEMNEGGCRGGASLRELCEGNLVGWLHYWGPWKKCRKGSGDGHLHRGPAGEPGRGLV